MNNILTKEEYANIYKKRINELVNKWKDDPDYDGTQATEEFEDTCTVDEIVGFYIANEKDRALIQWKENIDGLDLKKKDIKVTEILERLYGMDEFKGYTPKMLRELGADEDKPIIVICGGTQLIIKHAFVVTEENKEEFNDQYGSLVIDMDV